MADWKEVIDEHILSNTGDAIRNPMPAFNFVLEVEGVFFLPLRSVKPFTKENEYEYIKEGGVNDYVHMKRKPISKPFTFQIERYVGSERFLDPLANGTELLLPLILYVYRYQARQGVTESAPAWPSRVYTFTGCTVMSKEYGELNSEKSSILTETTTIAYRELIVLTNPVTDSQEKDKWTGKKGVDVLNAAKAATDDRSGANYVYGTNTDGVFARKDTSQYNKPQYKLSVDKEKQKYSTVAYEDQNYGNKIYKKDDNGVITREDDSPLNKPPWDGSFGPTPRYARRALMAEALSKK